MMVWLLNKIKTKKRKGFERKLKPFCFSSSFNNTKHENCFLD